MPLDRNRNELVVGGPEYRRVRRRRDDGSCRIKIEYSRLGDFLIAALGHRIELDSVDAIDPRKWRFADAAVKPPDSSRRPSSKPTSIEHRRLRRAAETGFRAPSQSRLERNIFHDSEKVRSIIR